MISEILSDGVEKPESRPLTHRRMGGDLGGKQMSSDGKKITYPRIGSGDPLAQKLSDDSELEAWLATLPRKVRFMLAMSVSALSLEKGQCRSRDDLMCFLSAAGLPVSRQAIENIECRALRKCRRTELAVIAKEHLTIK